MKSLPNIPKGEQREAFYKRINSLAKNIQIKAPTPLLEIELRLALATYHGNTLRVCWFMFKDWLLFTLDMKINVVAMWISDRVGWTKVYDVPETETMRSYKMRHGYKCHGSPNCNNDHCISDCLPKWFKWITRHPEI